MVEAGAYRFAGDMHLPADLIERALHFRTECYDPTCRDDDVRGEVAWPFRLPLRKIVDFQGRHLGYGAALQAMLAQFEAAGGQLVLGARLTSVQPSGSLSPQAVAWRLTFADSKVVESASVVLNMPRPALRRVTGLEEAFGASRWAALGCTARKFPPKVTEGPTTTKVYAVYEDAWWVSKLGFLRGVREDLASEPPVSMHYHDGEVLCTSGEADVSGAELWRPARETPIAARGRCRGVLQVFYRHSQSCPASFPTCMTFWAEQRCRSASDPATVTHKGSGVGPSRPKDASAGDEAGALARAVHSKLLRMHAGDFAAANISAADVAAISSPNALLFANWFHEGTLPGASSGLLTGPQDLIYDAAEGLPRACGGGGPLTHEEYEERVLGTGPWAQPGALGRGLHVANNDFAAAPAAEWHGPWAEDPLLLAERLLAKGFGLRPPAWLNATYYAARVLRAGRGGGAARDGGIGGAGAAGAWTYHSTAGVLV